MELFRKPPRPEPKCFFTGKHGGLIHEYDVKMVAELDGTPVKDAPDEKTYICEAHYPDRDDPKFVLCICRLCKERGINS